MNFWNEYTRFQSARLWKGGVECVNGLQVQLLHQSGKYSMSFLCYVRKLHRFHLEHVPLYNEYEFVLVFVFYNHLGFHLYGPFFLYDGWCSGIALTEMAGKSGSLQMQDSSSSNLNSFEKASYFWNYLYIYTGIGWTYRPGCNRGK